MSFGLELKRVLDTLDVSQTELAKRTNLTQAAVSMILNGEREPSLSTIVKILRFIPVKFERLAAEELKK